jgi:hypothetical protein
MRRWIVSKNIIIVQSLQIKSPKIGGNFSDFLENMILNIRILRFVLTLFVIKLSDSVKPEGSPQCTRQPSTLSPLNPVHTSIFRFSAIYFNTFILPMKAPQEMPLYQYHSPLHCAPHPSSIFCFF